MKKLLFLPLLFLALFTITSCDSDSDTPEPISGLTETEKNLYGTWKMDSEDYKYYDENGQEIHATGQTGLNNMFEYKDDGTVRFKIGEDPTWNTRKYDLEQDSNPKMLNVYNGAGDEVEIAYRIEKLTSSEMVLVHEYDENVMYEVNGEEFEAAKAVKTYNYTKQP
jgi:hypothetical protein